jgi:hypothetical protein
MALRSLKNLDLPQDRFPFVSSQSLPLPATNSHLSKIFSWRKWFPLKTERDFSVRNVGFLMMIKRRLVLSDLDVAAPQNTCIHENSLFQMILMLYYRLMLLKTKKTDNLSWLYYFRVPTKSNRDFSMNNTTSCRGSGG